MKVTSLVFLAAPTLICTALFTGCSSTAYDEGAAAGGRTMSLEEVVVTAAISGSAASNAAFYPEQNRDSFKKVDDNPVKQVAKDPVSTFSADVDTASYSFVRGTLNDGYLPPKEAVRLEEMINYFDYDYPEPDSAKKPFRASIVVHDSPWASQRKLIHIGVQGFNIEPEQQPDSNLVFLLDVSGSMEEADKLPLVIKSLELLLGQLKPTDTVAVVVYAGAAGVVLPPTPVKEKVKITKALGRLHAGGSTAGGEGIALAYALAEENFKKDAVNRIILATDGDFNVGMTDDDQLQGFVERKRDKGIYLSILGFGRGNYQDDLMQALAQNGNGVAAYIDTLSEAQKVLVHEATSSLFPIATDLKFQVEFNPELVREYRLLGYETRQLNQEDFKNDKVDAGDIGSGHTVTAIYEVAMTDSKNPFTEEQRYQDRQPQTVDSKATELAFLKIRYKLPGEKKSRLEELPITLNGFSPESVGDSMMREVNFATSVAGFAQLLKGGESLESWTLDDAQKLAKDNQGEDEYGYRSEFVQLVRKAGMAKVAEY